MNQQSPNPTNQKMLLISVALCGLSLFLFMILALNLSRKSGSNLEMYPITEPSYAVTQNGNNYTLTMTSAGGTASGIVGQIEWNPAQYTYQGAEGAGGDDFNPMVYVGRKGEGIVTVALLPKNLGPNETFDVPASLDILTVTLTPIGSGGTVSGALDLSKFWPEEGTCTPNCSCAVNTCADTTCSDGCGGTCNGTKTDGECSVSVCSSGQTKCLSAQIQTCKSDGSGWGAPTDCPYGQTCENNVCKMIGDPCVPNCSCAANTCVGTTCPDANSCGGTCNGTKTDGECSIGGDTDEHGCYISAGYSWCETKNRCISSRETCDTGVEPNHQCFWGMSWCESKDRCIFSFFESCPSTQTCDNDGVCDKGETIENCPGDCAVVCTLACPQGQELVPPCSCKPISNYCSVNNSKQCSLVGIPQLCIGNRWVDQTACISPQTCSDGACITGDPYCVPGQKKCTSDQTGYQICNSSGNDWSLAVDCSAGEKCQAINGGAGCAVISNYCATNNSKQCSINGVPQTCIDHTWTNQSICTGGKTCAGGECVTMTDPTQNLILIQTRLKGVSRAGVSIMAVVDILKNGEDTPLQTKTVTFESDSNGVFSSGTVSNGQFTPGAIAFDLGDYSGNLAIRIKGPKHLRRRINNIPKTSVIDLTAYELLPGDLPWDNDQQDGKLNEYDLNAILNNYTSLDKPEAGKIDIADVNYDNKVNSQDYSLVRATIFSQMDQ